MDKDAEEVEQNDWTAWPDHPINTNKMRDHVSSVINFKISNLSEPLLPDPPCISFKANGIAGRLEL